MDQLELMCFCGKPYHGDPGDETYVVGGVPCCTYECCKKAEKAALRGSLGTRYKKEWEGDHEHL